MELNWETKYFWQKCHWEFERDQFRSDERVSYKWKNILNSDGMINTLNECVGIKDWRNVCFKLKVGYQTTIQSTVTLQKYGCFYHETIQHELLHVLGNNYSLIFIW